MKLSDISLAHLPYYQQRALMRLQLLVTSMTHSKIERISSQITKAGNREANQNGELSPNDLRRLNKVVSSESDSFDSWLSLLLDNSMQHSAMIAFGSLARYHERYFSPLSSLSEGVAVSLVGDKVGPLSESISSQGIKDSLEAHSMAIVKAARERRYSDSYKLSDRIWSAGDRNRSALKNIVGLATVGGKTAFHFSQQIESFLGFNQNCPRWTRTRMFELTPKQRMRSRKGLLSGKTGHPCKARGMAYNAIRLVRNENQVVHHMAADKLIEVMPWVSEEQILLSPYHPPTGCKCEKIVKGGRGGKGIYPVGKIKLPIHPQCFCLKRPLLEPVPQFAKRVRDWINYQKTDQELDKYSSFLGAGRKTLIKIGMSAVASGFTRWLTGDADDLTSLIGE